MVPFLDLKAQYAQIREEVRIAVDRVLDSQACIGGPAVAELEAAVAMTCGAAHAVACSNGSDAIVLALKALGIGPGDEVLVPTFTFFATAGSVRLCGAKPIFVDVELDTFNIDLKSAAQLVSPACRAMIPVDLFGQASNMSAVMDFARQHKLKVIEDSAQAIGAEHKSQRVGGIADITTFSFYPTKNLGACGEGGLVTTNDGGIAKVLMQLRNHGQSSQYLHEMVGMNARLDAIQASILKIKLQHLDRWTAERQAHAAQYRELLSDCADRIALPVQAPESTRHVYNQFVVRVADRDKVKAGLAERGIGSGVYYPLCLHQQPCFAELGGKAGDHPKAERAAGEVLALPIFAELSPAQIREVAAALRELATRPLQ